MSNDSPTTGSNPFSEVASGSAVALSRDLSSNNHSTRFKFGTDPVGDVDEMANPLRRSDIIDVLLDLDNNEVTFRVRNRGVFEVDGPITHTSTVSIPNGLEWYAMMYNANAIPNTVYDFAGYRFIPDPGYKCWDE
jgi:hypothetical protein